MPDLLQVPDPLIVQAIAESLKASKAREDWCAAWRKGDGAALVAAHRRICSHRFSSKLSLAAFNS